MTKYILHGGYTSAQNPDNDAFFREFTEGIKDNGTILLNYFSRKREDVRRCFEQDSQRIQSLSKSKKLYFVIADERKLPEQLKAASVMYMKGGQTPWLIKKLSLTPNLRARFKGKVIAGSSAGVYALVEHYYTNDYQELRDGLGLLKLKAYCHFESKDLKIVEKLKNYKDKSLPILILPLQKMAIIYN